MHVEAWVGVLGPCMSAYEYAHAWGAWGSGGNFRG